MVFTLSEIVKSALANFNTQFDLRRVEAFVNENKNNLGTAADSFKSSIETIKTNIRWTEKNMKPIAEFLTRFNKQNN
jgi:hypothetical protein